VGTHYFLLGDLILKERYNHIRSQKCPWYKRCEEMYNQVTLVAFFCLNGHYDICKEFERLERYNTPSHRFFNYIYMGQKIFKERDYPCDRNEKEEV